VFILATGSNFFCYLQKKKTKKKKKKKSSTIGFTTMLVFQLSSTSDTICCEDDFIFVLLHGQGLSLEKKVKLTFFIAVKQWGIDLHEN
jgi:hypothetical protein